MQIERLRITGPLLLRPRRFGDARGSFVETFNARAFGDHVASIDFVQDNEAYSVSAGTLRGLHFQRPPTAQGKLVRVVRGAVVDVAVDIRHGSPKFGRHVAVRLDAAEGAQLWVPPGFAHGYCTLEPDTTVIYKVTDFYSPKDEGGVLWSDPALGIDWQLGGREPILADKDRALPLLADLPALFGHEGEAA